MEKKQIRTVEGIKVMWFLEPAFWTLARSLPISHWEKSHLNIHPFDPPVSQVPNLHLSPFCSQLPVHALERTGENKLKQTGDVHRKQTGVSRLGRNHKLEL